MSWNIIHEKWLRVPEDKATAPAILRASPTARKGAITMRIAFRLLPIVLAGLLTACGGGGYGAPATSTVQGSAGTTIPSTSSTSPLAIVRGNTSEVDAFAGSTPYSYSVTSSNAACATGTPATPSTPAAYGVLVSVPATAAAQCTATLTVNFVLAGSSTPVLADTIFVLAQ